MKARFLRLRLILAALALAGCAGAPVYNIGLTPGEQFRRRIAQLAKDCRLKPPARNESNRAVIY